ncbi:hypothetical protein HBH82_056730 [Parastagonospora nodorum]|nr:hypothetical protein HBH82_056730 [Parastagonospora nodorum]KAH4691341.1 hypothetical protein HBH78_084280 [Parastagonospora nodorum]KAH4705732.1 hypothetical protein HBH67_085270 [Parastagonospora nodorum]KAH4774664.1 hypothetical protein HBH63_140920 [Parastagonospora nodorum]KAH4786823.1 hypothetical protein HBH62_073850 [Parastagonospora nodorum]
MFCVHWVGINLSMYEVSAKIPVDTPAHTCPPTLVGVIQRRRPMVNTRLQNFFPRLVVFIA